MIALAIILFIVLALYVLLHISLVAYVDLSKDGAYVKLTYLGIKLWSTDDSKQDKSDENASEDKLSDDMPSTPQFELAEIKEADSADDDQTADSIAADIKDNEPKPDATRHDKSESGDKLSSIKSTIDCYKPYFPVAEKALRKLIKLIRIRDLDVCVTVGDSDAYKAGKKFGDVNALFYSSLGLLCCLFSVKIKHTEINCDFTSNKVDGSLKTSVLVRPSALMCLIVYLGVNYLRIRKHINREKIKENENHERKES